MPLLTRHATLPSHAQLSALLDDVDELLLLLDGRGRLSWCNRAAARLLDCVPGQALDAVLARADAASRGRLLAAVDGGGAGGPVTLRLSAGPSLPLVLSRQGAGGWLLRGPTEPPLPVLPPLTSGATTELVRLLWDSPLPLLVQNVSFAIVAANRAFLDAVGETPDGLIGADPARFIATEEHGDIQQHRDELLAALREQRQVDIKLERRIVDGRGGQRWLRCLPRWVSAADGSPLLLSMVQDVTVEHQAREQAERSGREIDSWFDLSPIGMLVYDAAGLVLRCNAAFEALVGHAPVLLHDAPRLLAQLLGWDGNAPHDDLQPDGQPLEVLANLVLPDGRRHRLRARLRAFAGENGALRVMAVVEDRSLEDAHDLAQLEIDALMHTAGVGVATYEASRGWVNSRPVRAGAPNPPSGLPGGLDAIGRDQVDPGSRGEFERLQQALREGRRAQVRYAVTVAGMGTRWLLTRVEPGELTGGRSALSVVTLDVTEQEEAHRRSEQLLRELSTILDGTPAGIAYLRGEQLLRCNQRFETMLGLRAGCGAGAALDDLFEGQPAARDLLRRALAEDGRHEIEIARGCDAGRLNWYALSASRVLAGGQPELMLVLTDVSRLKAQQEELSTLARERELMFSLAEVGMSYQRNDRIVRANAAMAELTGYAIDELTGMALAALFRDADSHDRLAPEQHAALQATGLWRGERLLRRRDGRLIWVQVSKRMVEAGDPQAGLIASYVDIDERSRAREAVQLQAERTRAILDSVLVGIVTVGDGGIEWMNRSARRMFGGELADFVGEPIAIVATDDADHPLRATHYRAALADGQAETFECRLRGRDGREYWVVGNAVVTGRDPARGGSGNQITFALLDIERRRQAELSIVQAQASLQRIIDTAPLAIALFDGASGRVLRLNQMAAQFFNRPVEAVLGRPPEEWFGAAEASMLREQLALAPERPDGVRLELPRSARVGGDDHGGGGAIERIWDMRIVSLGAAASEPQLLLVASEVTEQREAERARFDAAVSQREMLVKEVHHRIKNNLQGVAGLLQQTAARRPEVAALISEVVGQVQAIAQVHGLQVGLTGPLRIKPLVDAITASVQRTFGRTITVSVQGTPPHRFALPEAESIPIALTINELLTNAIKHGTPGDIRCELRCDEARLAISIDNPGQLPAGFSLGQVPAGVTGLGLVRSLLPRRSATLTLTQTEVGVQARVELVPPGITLLEPL